jgi:hypothetical protein
VAVPDPSGGRHGRCGGRTGRQRELAIEVREDNVVDRLYETAEHDWAHSHPMDLSDEGLLATSKIESKTRASVSVSRTKITHAASCVSLTISQRPFARNEARACPVPTEDLLDQFLAEPPGQWARAQ